jgi:DNA-binding XRE family transcriptional regulator
MLRVKRELSLREARRQANLTQAELARRLGVSARTIQHWESGTTEPQLRHKRILAAFFSALERQQKVAA